MFFLAVLGDQINSGSSWAMVITVGISWEFRNVRNFRGIRNVDINVGMTCGETVSGDTISGVMVGLY